jgi:hypothetical protein
MTKSKSGDTDRRIYAVNPASGNVSMPAALEGEHNIVGLATDEQNVYAAEYLATEN